MPHPKDFEQWKTIEMCANRDAVLRDAEALLRHVKAGEWPYARDRARNITENLVKIMHQGRMHDVSLDFKQRGK
jgi:hypothetical protein